MRAAGSRALGSQRRLHAQRARSPAAANGKPKVVSHSAGDCGSATGLRGTTAQAVPRNGHGMLRAVGKVPAQKKLPIFYEAGYTPH